jgi:hypothetical protein
VAKALTVMPLAAVGLAPAGQLVAFATLMVGISDSFGATSVGDGPKSCPEATVDRSLQAASGTASAPTQTANTNLLRMMFPRMAMIQCLDVVNVHRAAHEIGVI